jgi:hypothetical protein
MTRYELDVKMLVDSWVYGGIADLMKKMPEGVLGVNVIGIKKQEGAWDSSCLPCVMKDYEENSPKDEQLSKPSPTERPRHEWDSLADAMDVRIEAHKKNISEQSKLEPNRHEEGTLVPVLTKEEHDKLAFVQKELKKQNEGKNVWQVGYKTLLRGFGNETGRLSWVIEVVHTPLGKPVSMEFDTVGKLYSYIFNQRILRKGI